MSFGWIVDYAKDHPLPVAIVRVVIMQLGGAAGVLLYQAKQAELVEAQREIRALEKENEELKRAGQAALRYVGWLVETVQRAIQGMPSSIDRAKYVAEDLASDATSNSRHRNRLLQIVRDLDQDHEQAARAIRDVSIVIRLASEEPIAAAAHGEERSLIVRIIR